eukprot:4781049-Pleurochrysis_carterae.AAC.3
MSQRRANSIERTWVPGPSDVRVRDSEAHRSKRAWVARSPRAPNPDRVPPAATDENPVRQAGRSICWVVKGACGARARAWEDARPAGALDVEGENAQRRHADPLAVGRVADQIVEGDVHLLKPQKRRGSSQVWAKRLAASKGPQKSRASHA